MSAYENHSGPLVWALTAVLLVGVTGLARGSGDCDVAVVADGAFDLRVAGQSVGRSLEANKVHTFRLSLSQGDVIALRWRPRGGHESSNGLLLAAQTADGSELFASGPGWMCSHNETRRWAVREDVGGAPWHPVPAIGKGPVRSLADRLPGVEAITGKSSPAYVRGVVKWSKPESPLDIEALSEQWTRILEEERDVYFSPDSVKPGKITVYYRGELRPLEDLSEEDYPAARRYLEAALESPGRSGVSRGEVAIRKMLRGLRQAIGPNRDRGRALEWRILCIIAARVQLTWEDRAGGRHRFVSRIRDPAQWRQQINREMQRLSDIVFEKSWGRINIVGETVFSRAPITELKGSPGRYWFSSGSVCPAVKDLVRPGLARSVFVWIPREGDGEFPPLIGTATTAPARKSTGDAILTVVCTDHKRLAKAGGWASPNGGGLLHEFWHNVENALRHSLGYEGFIPSNHRQNEFEMLKAEIREQGLPEPEVQYDELLGFWPTWRMCRRLADRP